MKSDPEVYYRYRSFNAATAELLCHDRLYFASPDDFNDPFDCKPVVVSDSDLPTLREVLAALIKKRVCQEISSALRRVRLKDEDFALKQGEQHATAEFEKIAYYAIDPDNEHGREKAEQDMLVSAIQKELLKGYSKGVCCFSEEFDNLLLWSHYGDRHHGICIGYGCDRKPPPKLRRVRYGGDRTIKTSLIVKAILEKDKRAIAELDENVLLRKASAWEYEREWRILSDRGAQESCLQLLDVTFGLRCPDALKYTLVSALKHRVPKVKFYYMNVDEGKFELNRREEDIESLSRRFPRTAQTASELLEN